MNRYLEDLNERSDMDVAIIRAFRAGDIPAVEELFAASGEKATDITEVEDWSWLHIILLGDNPNIMPKVSIEYLLAQGLDVNAQDCYGNTPLHYALENANAEAAIVLLNAGADPNIPNKKNIRPLSLSGYLSDHHPLETLEKVLELMLQKGGNVHNTLNGDETILEGWAWRNENADEEWEKAIYRLMKKYA